MRVFVYGTLLRGEHNHRFLRNSQFIGEAQTTPGFALYDLGYFPAMVRADEGVVHGEVFEVDDATLRALDRLEGYPILYQRVLVDLADGSQALTYLQTQDQVRGRARIPSGSWRLF
jgi:gamma-glutamylaminecyclotransferase